MAGSTSRSSRRRRLLLRMMLRRGGQHALTLALYVVNVALIAIAGALGYIAWRDDIPVPAFLHTRIEQQLAQLGLAATFDSAHFDPTGRILVEGLKLQPQRFGEPVLEAELVLVRLDRVQLLAGRPVLAGAQASGVRLICPTAISPSGAPETVLDISTVRISHDDERWTIDGLAARAGALRVVMRGEFRTGLENEPRKPLDVEAMLRRFTELAPRAARALTLVAPFTAPRLDVVFSGTLGKPMAVSVRFTAEGWRDARIGEARGIELACDANLAPRNLPDEPIRVQARLGSFIRAGLAEAHDIVAAAEWPGPPSDEAPWPRRVQFATPQVRHPKLALDAPVVDLRPADFPRLAGEVEFKLGGETVALSGSADVRERSGTATLHTRGGRDWPVRGSALIGRDVSYYLTIAEPPDLAADIIVGAGLKWQHVDFRVLSGAINARGVPLDRARVIGTLTPDFVRVHHLEMSHGDESAIGSYEDEVATRKYRFLLRGAMRPASIAPWFGGWWGRFWKDFRFDGAAPAFDLDIRSMWGPGANFVVSGAMRGENLVVRDVPARAVRTHFLIRPNYYDLFDAEITRPEGRLAGETQMRFASGRNNPVQQRFQFSSTADLVALAKIFGPSGEELLAPYRYATPPAVEASGMIRSETSPTGLDLSLRLATEHEFRFHDFPLEAVATTAHITNGHVELPQIDARYAGGVVRATAVADHGHLKFDAALTDADYDGAVGTFTEFLNRQSPPPPDEREPAGFAARKTGGRLNLSLAAAGPTTNFRAYEGDGSVKITHADLARIDLFGMLSDLLRTIGLRLGGSNRNEAVATFQVRRNHIHFPQARITGSSAALELHGDYLLDDRSVDFRAKLFPLRESNGTITQLLGAILDPVSNLMEIRLTGTLRKPKWSFTRDPRALLRDLTTPPHPESGPPAPAESGDAAAPPDSPPPPADSSAAAPASEPES